MPADIAFIVFGSLSRSTATPSVRDTMTDSSDMAHLPIALFLRASLAAGVARRQLALRGASMLNSPKIKWPGRALHE
jgi:hypothetical protein